MKRHKTGMFNFKKAWFSKSVKKDLRQLWVSEGGIIDSWTTASYLFSEDASCPDTLRIFESVDYAENGITVFHSSYLSACEKVQDVGSVSIGHYVLPPTCVQKVMKAAVGRFVWEQEDTRNKEEYYSKCGNAEERQISHRAFKVGTPERKKSLCCSVQHYPVNNMVTGYVSMNDLKSYSGELHDFLPGHSDFLVTKARNG